MSDNSNKEITSNFFNNMKEKTSNAFNENKNTFTNTATNIKNNAVNMTNNVKNAINDKVNNFSADNLTQNIFEKSRNITSDLFNKGSDIIIDASNNKINNMINQGIYGSINKATSGIKNNINNSIREKMNSLAGNGNGFFGEIRKSIVNSFGRDIMNRVNNSILNTNFRSNLDIKNIWNKITSDNVNKNINSIVNSVTNSNKINNMISDAVSGGVNSIVDSFVSNNKISNLITKGQSYTSGGGKSYGDYDETYSVHELIINNPSNWKKPWLLHAINSSGSLDTFRERKKSYVSAQIADYISESMGIVMDYGVARAVDSNAFAVLPNVLESNNMSSLRTKVFFIRPDCNFFSRTNITSINDLKNIATNRLAAEFTRVTGKSDNIDSVLNPDLKYFPDLYQFVRAHLDVAIELSLSAGARNNALFPLLSNHCIEIPPLQFNTEVREGVKNMYGKAMPLIGITDRFTQDISLTFQDDKYGNISKLFYLWTLYNDTVTRPGLSRSLEYVGRNMMDAATSAYIFVIDDDDIIVSYGKLTGIIWKNLPSQILQHNANGLNPDDINKIDMQAVVFKPRMLDPFLFMEFNYMSGFNFDYIQPLRSSHRVLWHNHNNNYNNDSFMSPSLAPSTSLPVITNSNINMIFPESDGELHIDRPLSVFANKPGVVYDETIGEFRLVYSS